MITAPIKAGILFNDITDHLPIFLLMSTQQKTQSSKRPKARIFSDKNIQKFVDELSTVNWNQVLNHNNGNQDGSEFYKYLTGSTVNHFHLCKYQENGTRTSLGLLKAYLYQYGIKIDCIRRVFSIQMIPIFIDIICIKKSYVTALKGQKKSITWTFWMTGKIQPKTCGSTLVQFWIILKNVEVTYHRF